MARHTYTHCTYPFNTILLPPKKWLGDIRKGTQLHAEHTRMHEANIHGNTFHRIDWLYRNVRTHTHTQFVCPRNLMILQLGMICQYRRWQTNIILFVISVKINSSLGQYTIQKFVLFEKFKEYCYMLNHLSETVFI